MKLGTNNQRTFVVEEKAPCLSELEISKGLVIYSDHALRQRQILSMKRRMS